MPKPDAETVDMVEQEICCLIGWIDVCVSYDNRDMIVLLSFMTSI